MTVFLQSGLTAKIMPEKTKVGSVYKRIVKFEKEHIEFEDELDLLPKFFMRIFIALILSKTDHEIDHDVLLFLALIKCYCHRCAILLFLHDKDCFKSVEGSSITLNNLTIMHLYGIFRHPASRQDSNVLNTFRYDEHKQIVQTSSIVFQLWYFISTSINTKSLYSCIEKKLHLDKLYTDVFPHTVIQCEDTGNFFHFFDSPDSSNVFGIIAKTDRVDENNIRSQLTGIICNLISLCSESFNIYQYVYKDEECIFMNYTNFIPKNTDREKIISEILQEILYVTHIILLNFQYIFNKINLLIEDMESIAEKDIGKFSKWFDEILDDNEFKDELFNFKQLFNSFLGLYTDFDSEESVRIFKKLQKSKKNHIPPELRKIFLDAVDDLKDVFKQIQNVDLSEKNNEALKYFKKNKQRFKVLTKEDIEALNFEREENAHRTARQDLVERIAKKYGKDKIAKSKICMELGI